MYIQNNAMIQLSPTVCSQKIMQKLTFDSLTEFICDITSTMMFADDGLERIIIIIRFTTAAYPQGCKIYVHRISVESGRR